MSLTPDERALHAYLEPLRALPPVTRNPAVESRRGPWFRVAEFAAVVIAVILLAALIAVVSRGHPRITPTDHHPRGPQLTYLVHGDIAEGAWVNGGPRAWILRGQDVHALAWSPDGRKLAYLSGPTASCTLRIVTVEAAGTGAALSPQLVLPVHAACQRDDGVMWSPDGRRVAYTANQLVFRMWRHHGRVRRVVSNVITGLVVVTPATRGQQTVAAKIDGSDFTWWPGGRLAYVCGELLGPSAELKTQWCSIWPDGTHKTTLPVGGVWSPVSGRIAYLRSVTDPHSKLLYNSRIQAWTATIDGRHARRLVTGPVGAQVWPLLAWAPDGRRLLTSVLGAKHMQIIDARTGDAKTLEWWSAAALSTPSWRP